MRMNSILWAVVVVMVSPNLSHCENEPEPAETCLNPTPVQATPDTAARASIPTIVPPAQQAPQPVRSPEIGRPPIRVAGTPDPSRSHEAALLQQKLAERDRLQREIDALRAATGTAEMVLVNVQMLEVNLTKLRELGVDVTLPDGQAVDIEKWLSSERSPSEFQGHEDSTNGIVTALARRNIAKVLAQPKIMTVSGRPASLHVGGEVPIANSDGKEGTTLRNFGTEIQLLAETLSDNRVRLHVAPRVASIDETLSMQLGEQRIPAMKVRQCSFTTEVESGHSAVVSGLVEERTEAIESETGPESKTVEIALMVVVTAEIVK